MREQLVALSNLFVIQIAELLKKKKLLSCAFWKDVSCWFLKCGFAFCFSILLNLLLIFIVLEN